jgi:hypothetical protein
MDLLDKGLLVSTVAISSPLRGVHLILVVPAYTSSVADPESGYLDPDPGSGMENNLD